MGTTCDSGSLPDCPTTRSEIFLNLKFVWVRQEDVVGPFQSRHRACLVTAILVLVSSQGINGVELRGFSRWKIAKHDPRQKSTGEGDDDRYNRKDYAPTCDGGGGQATANADEHTDQSADKTDHHGLGEGLEQHIETASANRHADADFACAFGDRDQHDVHYADSADDKRDHGNRHQKRGERVLGCIGRGNGVGHVPDVDSSLPWRFISRALSSDCTTVMSAPGATLMTKSLTKR